MRYGVPPYTLTHPWMTDAVTISEPEPCDLGVVSHQLPLTIPNCPIYCPSFNTLEVPPPIIMDACGNVATGIPPDVLNIKPAPDLLLPPLPIVVCSDESAQIVLSSCLDQSTVVWDGNGQSGEGVIPVQINNASQVTQDYTFWAHANFNGCNSETMEIPVQVLPAVQGAFTVYPSPAMIDVSSVLQDASFTGGDQAIQWSWIVDGASGYSGENIPMVFSSLGPHEVCLHVETANGCSGDVCETIEVITAAIVAPTIFTPNGDGLNDTLEFQYLESFPTNDLEIRNRWGVPVFSKSGYKNDWDGDGMAEGVYYYVLKVNESISIGGYVQLVR